MPVTGCGRLCLAPLALCLMLPVGHLILLPTPHALSTFGPHPPQAQYLGFQRCQDHLLVNIANSIEDRGYLLWGGKGMRGGERTCNNNWLIKV